MGSKAPPLEMEIQLSVVEDLGIKLYGYLPPVISEIVANAWDADAKKVEVMLPDKTTNSDFKIVVRDDGHGMSYEEIRKKYLLVGRKRRDEDGEKTPGGRRPMGRKGIGKLSTFGVANTVEIDTVRSKERSSFKMDLEDLRKCAKSDGKYRPKTTAVKEKTGLKDGTTVTLSNLKRKTPINIQSVTRSIAKNFSAIGAGFEVLVNGKAITPADKLTKKDMEHTWEVNDLIRERKPAWRVTGWIGATRDPLNEEDRGIAILARKKLIQGPTFFDIKSGEKYSYSYLTGEITAEFFDMKEDLVSTNRRSLIWETDEGDALKAWGNKKLRGIADELAAKKKTRNEKELMKDAKLRNWLASLESPEKPIAKKLIKIITADNRLDNAQRIELMNFVRNSIEHQVFMSMVAGLDESPKSVDLLNMFKQWNVIENREMSRIVKGRLRAIEQLEKYIKENAKEVPTMHDYFKKWPWILDPTLGHWSEEVPYSKLLRERFPDKQLDEPDRRIDFISIGVGDTIHVVELKRPKYSAKVKDFDQITEYVGFVEEKLGNAPNQRYRTVSGSLIVGKVESNRAIRSRMKQAESARIYVKTYSDLVTVAKRLHAEFESQVS